MDYFIFFKFLNFASPSTSTRLAIYNIYLVLVNCQTRFINALYYLHNLETKFQVFSSNTSFIQSTKVSSVAYLSYEYNTLHVN